MKNYILSIISAAIICSICQSLLNEKSGTGKIVKLLSGILLTITVISPFSSISFRNVTDYFNDLSIDADTYVSNGLNAAQNDLSTIIKSQTESYILDKAKSLELDITVEVEVDDNNDSLPSGVTIRGTISPYAKKLMSAYIQEELGIAMEKQQWI